MPHVTPRTTSAVERCACGAARTVYYSHAGGGDGTSTTWDYWPTPWCPTSVSGHHTPTHEETAAPVATDTLPVAVAELRQAARLLRQRAQTATPGPWWVDESDDTWCLFGGGNNGQTHPRQILKAPKKSIEYAEYWPSPDDTAHLVPLAHPAVALALADWLDQAADQAHRHHTEAARPDRGLDPDAIVGEHYARPLAVARAYLGDQQ